MAETPDLTLPEFVGLLSAKAGARITLQEVNEHTTFEELGVDSLALLGVIAAIEQTWRLELPADAEQIPTVYDFLHQVNLLVQKAG